MMKTFLTRLFLFIVPLVVILSLPTTILWKNREYFFDLDKIRNSEHKLIAYKYSEKNYKNIKWDHLANSERYPIISLGSSRVLQFREEMFTKPFYNSGFTISKVVDFIPFLESLPEDKVPETMIISLDQWMFNPEYHDLSRIPNKYVWTNSFTKVPALDVIYNTTVDYFKAPSKEAQEVSHDYICFGIEANQNVSGFRDDGSYYYNSIIQRHLLYDTVPSDILFDKDFTEIKNGATKISSYYHGDRANEIAFEKLRELLTYCENRGIRIVAFFPPFANEIYDRLEHSGHYAYLDGLAQKVEEVFEEYPAEFYNLSTASLCESDDTEMIDGFHGGERVYVKMLLEMNEKSSILPDYVNSAQLREDLKNQVNRYLVYTY